MPSRECLRTAVMQAACFCLENIVDAMRLGLQNFYSAFCRAGGLLSAAHKNSDSIVCASGSAILPRSAIACQKTTQWYSGCAARRILMMISLMRFVHNIALLTKYFAPNRECFLMA